MDIILFMALLAVCLVFIYLGISNTEHSEFAIVGFTFLFLLGIGTMSTTLQYKIGEDKNITNQYEAYTDSQNVTTQIIIGQNETTRYSYSGMEGEGFVAHTVGFWLAVIGGIGIASVFWGWRRTKI